MTIYQTCDPPCGHLILRGGKQPNYQAPDMTNASDRLWRFDLPEHLVVDFSHGNSQKIHQHQLEIAETVWQKNCDGSQAMVGIVAESFLVAGAQKYSLEHPLVYGQSMTDPCLNWQDPEKMRLMLGEVVSQRLATAQSVI